MARIYYPDNTEARQPDLAQNILDQEDFSDIEFDFNNFKTKLINKEPVILTGKKALINWIARAVNTSNVIPVFNGSTYGERYNSIRSNAKNNFKFLRGGIEENITTNLLTNPYIQSVSNFEWLDTYNVSITIKSDKYGYIKTGGITVG